MKSPYLNIVFLLSISIFSCSSPFENIQETDITQVEQVLSEEYEITDYWMMEAGPMSGEADTSRYTIKFVTDADDSTTYVIENFAGNYNVKTFIKADSFFVEGQEFLNFDNTNAYVEGSGFLKSDSIFISYFSGGSFGTVVGNCTGIARKK